MWAYCPLAVLVVRVSTGKVIEEAESVDTPCLVKCDFEQTDLARIIGGRL